MKRSSKEISIFNLSALDLFASALGAFIVIAIVVFPFFPNVSPDLPNASPDTPNASPDSELLVAQLAQMQAELNETRTDLQKCQADLTESQQQNRQCQANIRKKFLLILISWGSKDDIDLHVIDPAGNEFYYKKPTYSGTHGKLEEDNIRGPGNEIWLHPEASPGQYKIYYHLFTKRDRSALAKVRGAMITPKGREEIPTQTLIRAREKPLVAIVTVDAQGNSRLTTQ